ncbi:virulence factor TspB C-terminal domain-related protein [Paracidovorax valerianellae]|uniref:virulence factor TspB C-terminal domain-related protein n=1 Tax=Paracidovorax valerianellae TaxID=187868 RepID=UPI0015878664|nr:virulence factor TspB C-terminal domain-related protein [Paracidovorax valerianellae]MDA8446348.1 hypothetical protein [Paracidovorax valerianellae]
MTANVGGQAVKMPVAYRLAANAPRIAAAVVFANPALRIGVGIAAWLLTGKLVWDATDGVWRQVFDPNSTDGLEYQMPDGSWSTSLIGTCTAHLAFSRSSGGAFYRAVAVSGPGQCSYEYSFSEGPNAQWAKSTVTPPKRQVPVQDECQPGTIPMLGGCATPAIPAPEFDKILNPDNQPAWPMPSTVPKELPPGTVLPVEQPVPNPSPGLNPLPQPLFVPSGNPVPNPKFDPSAPVSPANQPYIQPGVRVVPTPTPRLPWQVDLQPVDRPVDSPDPNPDPVTDPDPKDDAPKEETPDLCEKNPEILACQKLGDITPKDLQKKTVTLSINREDGFGPSNSSCPAPKEFAVFGKPMAFRWDLLCDFASQIRPLLVGFAYLSAALAFMGLSRRD